MDDVPIANLEAELGCLTGSFLHVGEPSKPYPTPSLMSHLAPRREHGDSHAFLDVPSTSIARLETSFNNKTLHPFGNEGNISWTSPEGELLQLAKCIDNRLICTEFKGSIERGQSHASRTKVLERALHKPHGSCLGIGISLNIDMKLTETSWLHNPWPRFYFRADSLAVRLQYYADAHSIDQDFQLRNNGHGPLSVSYAFSSDICFREHEREESGVIHPIPTYQSLERQLLFGNSEVTVRDVTMGYQMAMTLFLNGQRQSLWHADRAKGNYEGASRTEDSESLILESDKLQKVEEKLKDIITARSFVDDVADSEIRGFYRKHSDRKRRAERSEGYSEHNFARSSHQITVPSESTQELRVIMRLSSLTDAGVTSDEVQSQVSKFARTESKRMSGGENNRKAQAGLEGIRIRQRLVLAIARMFSPKPHEPLSRECISELAYYHLGLGEALDDIGLAGEARYHLFTYCLMTECSFPEPLRLNRAWFRYATFLDDYGWQPSALQILKQPHQSLSLRAPQNPALYALREEVRIRLASIYLRQGSFSRAESICSLNP